MVVDAVGSLKNYTEPSDHYRYGNRDDDFHAGRRRLFYRWMIVPGVMLSVNALVPVLS